MALSLARQAIILRSAESLYSASEWLCSVRHVGPKREVDFHPCRLGNLTCRTDLSACSATSPNYSYGATVTLPGGGTRSLPHVVASVAGTVDGVADPSYQYDANGNLTAGAGRNISYTSYNLPATLARSGASLTWTYGPEHQRVRQVASDGATTIFVHPDAANALAYERYTAPGDRPSSRRAASPWPSWSSPAAPGRRNGCTTRKWGTSISRPLSSE
ncbi:MAG: hypothetical protein HY778_02085 [Betaproteobacteria bacterium]|nr:hypothetical protein [Betaproteobacteria bacterium]